LRRELIDSVDVSVGFVVWSGKETNGTFNQSDFVAVNIPFSRA